ncbi:hypothetical protein ColKHC_00256 [Colletotrichum higginsianum]|nr:hypothetical protein ColKHC_00256 [Colletotrichum higginsianum]
MVAAIRIDAPSFLHSKAAADNSSLTLFTRPAPPALRSDTKWDLGLHPELSDREISGVLP